MFPFLAFLVTFLLLVNLYLDDGYVLVRSMDSAVVVHPRVYSSTWRFLLSRGHWFTSRSLLRRLVIITTRSSFYLCLKEAEKRQLGGTLIQPAHSDGYVHPFRDFSNFSGTINVTYRYLAGTPLPRKSGCFGAALMQLTPSPEHFPSFLQSI